MLELLKLLLLLSSLDFVFECLDLLLFGHLMLLFGRSWVISLPDQVFFFVRLLAVVVLLVVSDIVFVYQGQSSVRLSMLSEVPLLYDGFRLKLVRHFELLVLHSKHLGRVRLLLVDA